VPVAFRFRATDGEEVPVFRRLVVAALAGLLVLGAAPPRALAASDDWRPIDGHYRCVWHCQERGWLFRPTPKSAGSKARPAAKAMTRKKAAVSQKATQGMAPAPVDKKGPPPTGDVTDPAGSAVEEVPADDHGGDLDRRPRAGRGDGVGFGFFSWLTSLFGDRTWKTSRPTEPRRAPRSWNGLHDEGRDFGDPFDRGYPRDSFAPGEPHPDAWPWDPGGCWHHFGCWHPRPCSYPDWCWRPRPHYRDHWRWDDGRDSGYTAHRQHPRGRDF